MDLRDLRGARAEFEAVLRGAADNILASRFLGECLEGLGDLGSALLQYRATLRLAPGDRNLEAQIRALEQKLTPATAAAPVPPVPVSRPPTLPREGAIPVLDVDGPMELETSLDKTAAWRPTPVPPPPATHPTAPEPLQPSIGSGFRGAPLVTDDSPGVEASDPHPVEALVTGGVEAPAASEPVALITAGAEAPPPTEPHVVNQSFPDDWDASGPAAAAPVGESPEGSEAPPLSSSTLAELYFNQGFTRQAIDVYRELLEREPANERIAARIAELEAFDRQIAGRPSAPPPVAADPRVLRRAAIERTITRLEGFLAAVRRA
jgi:tetratricopeptide (TPR) repeat protein